MHILMIECNPNGMAGIAGVLDLGHDVTLVSVDPDFYLAVSPLTEAAYRYCRHAPGMDVILTGTGKLDHLKDNIRSIHAPPLPAPVLDRLHEIFGEVTTVTGNPLTGGGG